MLMGMLSGFAAALINCAGYLFSAGFLLRYKSPVRLLVISSVVMMLVSIPFVWWLFPFDMVPDIWSYLGQILLTSTLFLLGQGAFFGSMRYFEASRVSSLLGLKIVVLSLIFILSGGVLNWMQIAAVLLAAMAAMIFNWSGSGKSSNQGWLLLLVTLCCYSCVDMLETSLVVKVHEYTQWHKLRSAVAVVPMIYGVLGLIVSPAWLWMRPSVGEVQKAWPYALLWLGSQVLLLCCFAFLQPVFGNVILATRGIFSVLIGMLLPGLGLAALDSTIPASMWIRRAVAALVMLAAIGVYSFGSL